jgi:hypothetical protein
MVERSYRGQARHLVGMGTEMLKLCAGVLESPVPTGRAPPSGLARWSRVRDVLVDAAGRRPAGMRQLAEELGEKDVWYALRILERHGLLTATFAGAPTARNCATVGRYASRGARRARRSPP